MVLQESLSRAQGEGEAVAEQARAELERTGARWAVEEGVVQLSEIGRQTAARARFADLVVLTHPYGQDNVIEREPVVEGALFEGQAPVLVLPDSATANPAPRRVAIAWNESPEALRAVRAALPILKGADMVRVVIIDPPAHGPNRSDPGGALAQYLARHGVSVEIDVLTRTMPRVSDVLLRNVADQNVEWLVMGAYGHSRFREAILGGATRDMLERCSVPVFLAH
jgi:nucleotide-binding universal stress UspA family protein